MGDVIDIRSRLRRERTGIGLSIESKPNRIFLTHGDSQEIWDMAPDHAERLARRLKTAARVARRMAGDLAETVTVNQRRDAMRLVDEPKD